MGAILVSGCTILEGCEAEDQHAGLGRPFSFRLILPVQAHTRPACPHKTELETYYQNSPRIMCLAKDSKDELTPWLNIIDHCAQIQENVSDFFHSRCGSHDQLNPKQSRYNSGRLLPREAHIVRSNIGKVNRNNSRDNWVDMSHQLLLLKSSMGGNRTNARQRNLGKSANHLATVGIF